MSWSVFVNLTQDEVDHAVSKGTERQESADRKKSVSAFPEQFSNQLLLNHQHAACAELAVAKFLRIDTELGVDVYSVPDIDGTRIDVRWSRSRNHCKVKKEDIEKDRVIVGCVGPMNRVEILGWILASDAPSRCRSSDPSDGRPPCLFIEEPAWENPYHLTEEIYQLEEPLPRTSFVSVTWSNTILAVITRSLLSP